MSTSTTYTVRGMTCGGCAGKVSGAVGAVAGVVDTDVDIATGTLVVTGPADDTAVRAAIQAAGYQVG